MAGQAGWVVRGSGWNRAAKKVSTGVIMLRLYRQNSALWPHEPLAFPVCSLVAWARREGGLVIAAAVHAKLTAHPGVTAGFADDFLEKTGRLAQVPSLRMSTAS